MCVIFVGSQPPSREWLLEHAKPLVVRPAKIRAALVKLIEINPLYSDVRLNEDVLRSLDPVGLAPVQIDVHTPSTAEEAQGSHYDDCDTSDIPIEPSGEDSEEFETLMENVGIANLDMNHVSSNAMKAAALKHLKDGGGYLAVQHGSQPVSEYDDENLFPLLYPTLFPYGTGGFSKCQKTKLSFEALGQHYLGLFDKRFQEHYSFMFVFFNMIQQRVASQQTNLRASRVDFNMIASDLVNVSNDAIQAVIDHLSKGDSITAKTPEEATVLKLMRDVQTVSSNIPGSAATRIAMWNEIRGLILRLGLPSFYVTINPADIYNPIVHFMSGHDFDLNNMLPEDVPHLHEQKKFVAKNPFVAAKFFRRSIDAFISALLGCDHKDRKPGILGRLSSYYGCVEAQGRGTLHCHMLIWLDGAPDAQQIKDRFVRDKDTSFKDRLLAFLEDTIRNDHPPAPKDSHSTRDEFHPLALRPDLNASPEALARDLHLVVGKCQLHEHKPTCFKYVTNFDKKKWRGYDPRLCRFNMHPDNKVGESTMNEETGEISLRVSDGLVNNFCETIIQAVRCNMDIKFIGSGKSAKAILYYITDYITKTQLKAHVSYSALKAGVDKMRLQSEASNMIQVKARKLLLKCSNSLLG